MKFKNSTLELFLLALILIGLSYFFHSKTVNEYPSHIHAWAAADRYALAIGFTNNGMNFFRPETFNLNPQFPPKQKLIDEQGITAVDFPIHEYIIGGLMLITNTRSPFVFRLYTMCYALVGLLFLYLIARLFIKNRILLFSLLIFVFTAPVYTYYINNFLPTIASLSNIFIAFYFYFRFVENKKNKLLFISILFFTIAALCRTPFAIFLISVLCAEILNSIKTKIINRKLYFGFIISFIVIIGYFIYNHFLYLKYGSVFLRNPLTPKSFDELIELLQQTYQNWAFQYFTSYHYLFFVLLFVVSLISYFYFKLKCTEIQKQLFILFLISGFGSVTYCLLMAKQLTAHDYYFLDTLFTVCIFALLFIISFIQFQSKLTNILGIIFVIIFSFLMIKTSNTVQIKRCDTGSWDRMEITKQNFIGTDKFLDSLHISPKAKILVIDSYSPNLPFILLNRKGFAVLSTKREYIINSLTWNYDYVILQDQFVLSDIISVYPEIINKLIFIAGNGKISIYQRASNNLTNNTLEQFLGFNLLNKIFSETLNYDSLPHKKCWEQVDSVANTVCNSKPNCGFISANREFGAICSIPDTLADFRQNSKVVISANFLSFSQWSELQLVTIINKADKNLFNANYNVKDYLKNNNNWQNQKFIFVLPAVNEPDATLKVYFWNFGKNYFYYDDFSIDVYRRK